MKLQGITGNEYWFGGHSYFNKEQRPNILESLLKEFWKEENLEYFDLFLLESDITDSYIYIKVNDTFGDFQHLIVFRNTNTDLDSKEWKDFTSFLKNNKQRITDQNFIGFNDLIRDINSLKEYLKKWASKTFLNTRGISDISFSDAKKMYDIYKNAPNDLKQNKLHEHFIKIQFKDKFNLSSFYKDYFIISFPDKEGNLINAEIHHIGHSREYGEPIFRVSRNIKESTSNDILLECLFNAINNQTLSVHYPINLAGKFYKASDEKFEYEKVEHCLSIPEAEIFSLNKDLAFFGYTYITEHEDKELVSFSLRFFILDIERKVVFECLEEERVDLDISNLDMEDQFTLSNYDYLEYADFNEYEDMYEIEGPCNLRFTIKIVKIGSEHFAVLYDSRVSFDFNRKYISKDDIKKNSNALAVIKLNFEIEEVEYFKY